MEPPSTPFALQSSFPSVIFSYCTKTDGGRGEQRMWQIANFLKKHGSTRTARSTGRASPADALKGFLGRK